MGRCVREVTVLQSHKSRTIDVRFGLQFTSKLKEEETLKCNIGGGYGYNSSTDQTYTLTRNRFIHWRIRDNTLELGEESLDVNLCGNSLKIHFVDGTLVPGLSIFESQSSVYVLVATTNSVHRIVFPHPNVQRHVHGGTSSFIQKTSSIFNTTSIPELQEPWNFAAFSKCCKSSSAWVCPDGHAIFALATEVGTILFVKLPPIGVHDEGEIFELQQSSVIQRLWSSLVPSSLRGESGLYNGIIGLEILAIGHQMFIFTLCQDHKLRIWSFQKQECISEKDILEDVPDDVDVNTVSSQNNKIKTAFDSHTNKLYIGVFLSLHYQNQFCIYEALADGCDVYITPVSHMYSPPGNLIDFAITFSDIWAQWTASDGQCATYVMKIENDENESRWNQVFCESSNFPVVVPPYKEPKEVYLNEMFYPGRFLDQAIIKAIQIYQHGIPLGCRSDEGTELKKQVINLIDTEIQLSASNSELSYSEYHDLQLSCWDKFFCCVVQYHQAACQAIGFFVDKVTSLVVIIKTDILSILKDCDSVERLYLFPPQQEIETFDGELSLNKSLKQSQEIVYNTIRLVSNLLSNENKADIGNDLKYGCHPAEMAHHIAESLVTGQSNGKSEFMFEIETSLQKVPNLFECFQIIVRSLDLSGIQLHNNETGPAHLENPSKFGSQFMLSIIASSYQQTINTYMSMCRDFLVLLAVVDYLGAKAGIDPHFTTDISSIYIPKVVFLLRVYHSLHWISELEVIPPPSNVIEVNLKQLAALEICDGNQENLTDDSTKTTILKLLLQKIIDSKLYFLLLSKMDQTKETVNHLSAGIHASILINQAISCVAGSIWPTSSNSFIPDFLLANYQYLHLQDYCKLIDHWCEPNQAYRQFLCGQSYLILGENLKALDFFLRAAEEIDTDDIFMQTFLRETDLSNNENLVVLFYVKVMRLFEQFEVPDMVITIANKALNTASPDDPNIPNLWSNIFKQHLQLGHIDQAYAALISNPDLSRKRDCLHHFMVVLCERGQIQELCEYPYTNLQEEFVDIMESHARTTDITTHQYYDVLYSFHIFRGNYRKAGSVMYEYGGRLERELPGKKGLQKQAKCYLAAINALKLVNPKNAWIVTPWDRAENKKTEECPNGSHKRKQEEDDVWYGTDRNKRHARKLTVIQLKDLEKDYLLVLARLQLLQLDVDPSQGTGPPLSPDETSILLIQSGLFDTAFTLASSFNLPKDMIFEGIAARCIRQCYGLTSSGEEVSAEAWNWLLQNDTVSSNLMQVKRPADQAWQLLQSYLEKHQDENTANCHGYYRCVVNKLLTMGAPLPTWLYNHYKKLNPADLLYLLVTYDMLQDAAELAIEYLHAVLGQGKEYFGLKASLQATSPSVWLPYTTLDHLLASLYSASPESNLAEMRQKLLDQLERYYEQVERVSEDMTSTARKRSQRRIMKTFSPQ